MSASTASGETSARCGRANGEVGARFRERVTEIWLPSEAWSKKTCRKTCDRTDQSEVGGEPPFRATSSAPPSGPATSSGPGRTGRRCSARPRVGGEPRWRFACPSGQFAGPRSRDQLRRRGPALGPAEAAGVLDRTRRRVLLQVGPADRVLESLAARLHRPDRDLALAEQDRPAGLYEERPVPPAGPDLPRPDEHAPLDHHGPDADEPVWPVAGPDAQDGAVADRRDDGAGESGLRFHARPPQRPRSGLRVEYKCGSPVFHEPVPMFGCRAVPFAPDSANPPTGPPTPSGPGGSIAT